MEMWNMSVAFKLFSSSIPISARLMIMVLYELLLLGLHLFCMRLVYVVIKAFYKFEVFHLKADLQLSKSRLTAWNESVFSRRHVFSGSL